MQKHLRLLYFLLALLPILLSSCVSKKKHLEITAAYDNKVDSLLYRLDTAGNRIYQLNLSIAERRGENNALLASQDKMLSRIVELDDEIERLQNETATRVGSLDEGLQQRDAIIAAKQAKIDALLATLSQRDKAMEQLQQAILDTLRRLDSTVYTVAITNGQLSVSLQTDFLFYKGSVNKTHTAGRQAVENISQVLANYPSLDVLVIGHTNNSPQRRGAIEDKWEFSALQAATVVQMMTKKYELSASRVMVGAKSEFEPRASNTTAEGRAKNERIEIRAYPSLERLVRDLGRALE